MNLLKSFENTTGLKPGKSFIYEKLFPLDFDKYIILETQSKEGSYHYVFWFRVIELIEPILNQKGIKIIHFVEDRKYHFNHTYVDASVLLSQKAFLIRKSLLFSGSSKVYSLIASENNIPQCFIKCDYNLDNVLVSQSETIDTNFKRKNFLNPTVFDINNIRPEEVAKKILKTLTGEEHIFDNTLSIGKVYSTQSIEVVPDCSFKIANNSKNEIIVRMDLLFSEENLDAQLGLEACSVVTNKKIKTSILVNKAKQIKKLYFKVEKNSDPSFLDELDDLRINYELITSLTGDDLDKEKLKYLNHKRLNKLNVVDLSFLDGLDKSQVYFKTNKIVIKSGKTYPTRSHCALGISDANVRASSFPLPSQFDQSFKEESDYFYFLTKEQI